jgi:hypothetical protein
MKDKGMVERSDALDTRIEKKAPDLADIFKYGQRNRRLIRFTIFCLLVDIFLTVAVGIVLEGQHRQDVAIFKNNNSITASCEANNKFRQGDHGLWNYILSIPPQTPLTPQQVIIKSNVEKVVTKTFAPRNCSKV